MIRIVFAPLANAFSVMIMPGLGVSYAGPPRPTDNALDRPQAKSISAKLADAGGAGESARLDASPKLIDKLKHLESEEDVCLLALMDRHAEIAYLVSEASGVSLRTQRRT
jgi:hypothetical protein